MVGSRTLRGFLPRFLALFLVLVTTAEARAQDVELLGQIHGTRPPEAYFRQLRQDPSAYRFRLDGRERLEQLRSGMNERGGLGAVRSSGDLPARGLGPRNETVAGTFHFPLVLGLFSDGPQTPPFSGPEVETEFFDGPNSNGQTIPEFYDQISSGLVRMEGVTFDWQQTGMTREDVTLGDSGLSSSHTAGIGAYIEEILRALDETGVDWSRFDQSGDGFVDVLTVLHPERGAECPGGGANRIWSHRWSLSSVTEGRLPNGFRTSTPRPDGQGNIHIDDYTVQPLLACDGERISEIGTFAHELGHGFGLPDLYRTRPQSLVAGAGNWDLMGTGGWGCGSATPERPCHMGAWSKSALGWLTVEEVAPDTDELVTLEPVELGGRVLKLPARDGSNEYLLLENRQRLGNDEGLPEPGLLIWHIDQEILDEHWSANRVNSYLDRQGVWLRQADGRDDLTTRGGGRGDAGDPFPGCIKPSPLDNLDPTVPCAENREFHAGKPPEALSHQGRGLGVTLTEIELVGAPPHDVRFRLNTRLSTITVEAEREGTPVELAGFELDGELRTTPVVFRSAPFQSHQITAPAGIPLRPGERVPFAAWLDGAPRTRTFAAGLSDSRLVASYRDEEVRLSVVTNDPAAGIVPGTFTADPGRKMPEADGFWFARGTQLSVLATPRTGFAFRDWLGVSDSRANPIAYLLNEPGELTANFDLVYKLGPVPELVEIQATVPQEIVLEVRDGNAPVRWTIQDGSLPEGLALDSETGVIRGAATRKGEFRAAVLARDAIGLEARADVRIRVSSPTLAVELLVRPFLHPGDAVTQAQRAYLDAEGNADGDYDVGDLRAYLLASPDPGDAVHAPLSRTIRVQMGELTAPLPRGGDGRE